MPNPKLVNRLLRCAVARTTMLVVACAALFPALAEADVAAAPASVAPPTWLKPAEKQVSPPPSATIKPDGTRAVWASDDRKSIYGATRADSTAEWAAPERLLWTRGTVGQIVFSPDGHSIAYENQRTWNDDRTPDDVWQFICVFDIRTRRISYVDPSFGADSNPIWSADGNQITFTRRVYGLPDSQLTKSVTRLERGAWKPPAPGPSEQFTMAAAIAAPYIYPPVPSTDGRAIGYITREARSRNIYFLRLGEPARRLVNYPEDDGRDLGELAISNAGGALAYVRGGYVNRQGDSPNPASDPEMPQRQVWLVGADGDPPHLLGAGSEPVFTPDDRYILWRARGTVSAAPLIWSGRRLAGVGEPQEYLIGEHAGLRFSPDGAKAAYERGTAIEIYDIASRTAVVIPHGADTDFGPVWSPDSRHLAFRREPSDSPGIERNFCGGGERYCGPMIASQPWAIWAVDVSNLNPRKVWQAAAGVGSVYYGLDQDYSPGQHGDEMFWSADDRIAFAWERDGWRHLYSVPASGGQATLLTAGDGEVETAALSSDRRQIFIATNIGDLGRRHIAAVGFDGAPMRPVTGGEKSQWAPTPLAGGKIAYLGAGWADPPQLSIREPGGKTTTAEFPRAPSGYPGALFVKPQLVEFPAADGQTAFGQLFVPTRSRGCAIIFSHGGIRRQMLPGFHYMDAYHYLYEMNQYLASRGCVVLSVEYRSSIMRGEAFRNAKGWGFAGNSEIIDFVGAAKYLLKRSDVDSSRGVGIYGLSWGGYMTAEALAQHSDLFKVGFDMAGVHTVSDPAGYQNSAVGHIATWSSPVFLIQGDDDMNVDFNQGIALARALQTKRPDVEFKQQVLPGQTHDLYQTYQQLVEAYARGSDFLLSHLGVN